MCLPERVAILNCFDANANVLFTGRGKLVLVVHKTMHVFVKGDQAMIREIKPVIRKLKPVNRKLKPMNRKLDPVNHKPRLNTIRP